MFQKLNLCTQGKYKNSLDGIVNDLRFAVLLLMIFFVNLFRPVPSCRQIQIQAVQLSGYRLFHVRASILDVGLIILNLGLIMLDVGLTILDVGLVIFLVSRTDYTRCIAHAHIHKLHNFITFRMLHEIKCNIDAKRYPFDAHYCTIYIIKG